MTLYLRQVAICDQCGERVVFDDGNPNACKVALQEMGWRNVIRDKGRELLCTACVNRYTADEMKRLTAKAGGIAPLIALQKSRNRPGVFIDPSCGEPVPFTAAYYEPFSKEHPLNLRCLTCCVRAAARRGYRVDIDRYLPSDTPHPVAKETQPSLF